MALRLAAGIPAEEIERLVRREIHRVNYRYLAGYTSRTAYDHEIAAIEEAQRRAKRDLTEAAEVTFT